MIQVDALEGGRVVSGVCSGGSSAALLHLWGGGLSADLEAALGDLSLSGVSSGGLLFLLLFIRQYLRFLVLKS